MEFPYPRVHFAIRFILLSGMLAAILLIMALPDAGNAWLWGFGALALAAIALVNLSPAFTAHEISDEGINLRHGILFKASFPFSDIESVEKLETGLWAFGLIPAGARGRIVLANGNRNLVTVKLRDRRRFGMLLGRSSREIIIDLVSPDEFVKAANEKLQR